MKLDVMNAVKAYFKRNLGREDLTNNGTIPLYAHKCLNKMYLTLFCALLSSTIGSYFHLNLFTVLTAAGTIIFLFTTSPLAVRVRVLLLMTAAYSIGASFRLDFLPNISSELIKGKTLFRFIVVRALIVYREGLFIDWLLVILLSLVTIIST